MRKTRSSSRVAHPPARAALLVVAEPEARLDLAAEAAQGGGRDHALGRAADAHHARGRPCRTAHEIAADRSPSEISLIRAPVPRTSAIRSS